MRTRLVIIGLVGAVVGGCMLKPEGTKEQEQQLTAAGKLYEKPFEQRQLPELPTPATWQDVLQRAFLANGDLEAAYNEWRAANERIGIASYWPNSNVNLGFGYTFSGGNIKTWDRVSGSAAFDPSVTLKLPTKVKKTGEVALAEARQAAEAFAATKFRIQKQVLTTYLDLALMEEQIRLQQSNLDLQRLTMDNARSRLQAGGSQQDLIKAELAVRMSENELASMRSQAQAMKAMLNGMMARKADAALTLPAALPESRPVPGDDQLIGMGVDTSPDIRRLAMQVQGRKDAIDLAKMQYLPDISPTASFAGSMSQTLGAMVMIPTTVPMIEASIREANAMRSASEAMLRQTRQDKAATFVATLYAMRNAERQEQYYRDEIMPATQEVVATARVEYVSGRVGLTDLLLAQQMLIDVDQSIARFHTDREKRLTELEELAGMDVEALRVATTQAATAPATQATAPGTESK